MRVLRLLRHVDLALFQTLQEVVRGKIDQLDIIGLFEHRVRHRFTHPHSGDLSNHIVQALQMLHVDGRIDVDARLQEFLSRPAIVSDAENREHWCGPVRP